MGSKGFLPVIYKENWCFNISKMVVKKVIPKKDFGEGYGEIYNKTDFLNLVSGRSLFLD